MQNSNYNYTEEELDFFLKEEVEWREQLPKFSFYELLKIFPEATKSARRGLKIRLKLTREKIRELHEMQGKYYEEVICKADFRDQVWLKEDSDISYLKLHQRLESRIKSLMFQLSHLDELEGKPSTIKKGAINERDIERAKQIPITDFYVGKLQKFGKKAKGRCPFHKENDASFTIYLNQNSFYCYGCHEGGSVIDFIMKQQNINFLSAVKFLIK